MTGRTGHRAPRGTTRGVVSATVLALAAAVVSPAAPSGGAPGVPSVSEPGVAMHLVTLDGPGLAGTDPGRRVEARARFRRAQDRTLAGLDAPEPAYRWLTALNGYAVELTDAQAATLAARPGVVAVEPDGVRPMASPPRTPGPAAPGSPSRATRGGAGVVVGVVDSGIDTENRAFDDARRLGREPRGFDGVCDGDVCSDKIVGAGWFVAGFGRDALASSATLSVRDDAGHGTAVASVAAGNSGLEVTGRDPLGSFAGVAPQARVAAYKACWTAPDPADDGCATSDLVSAVDRAVRDGVDVLSLAVAGPARIDTLDRALLGAAEADVVVVAAAGNDPDTYAAHGVPWALTVGAHTTPVRRGRLSLADGTAVTGAMAERRTLTDLRVVLGTEAAAPDARAADARLCRPGSLDAALVEGAAVVCERGAVSRLEKSAGVDRAGGVAMVLTDRRGGNLTLDVHRVPVLHLTAADGRRLRTALASDDGSGRGATLAPDGLGIARPRPAGFSAGGDPAGGLVTPSLLAPGVGVLGAAPPGPQSNGWRSFSGTSAATAVVAGAAARVRAERPGWSADRVRSALSTTARPFEDAGVLRQGAGRVRPGEAARPGLVYELDAADLRRYLEGDLDPVAANTGSVLVRGGATTVVRRVRNVSGRALYFSSTAEGFARHDVTVRPAALRLAPGETARFRIAIGAAGGPGGLDDGTVTWRGADGSRARIPVVVSR